MNKIKCDLKSHATNLFAPPHKVSRTQIYIFDQRQYVHSNDGEIPKLEIPVFSEFSNPDSRDFLKLVPGFFGIFGIMNLCCINIDAK